MTNVLLWGPLAQPELLCVVLADPAVLLTPVNLETFEIKSSSPDLQQLTQGVGLVAACRVTLGDAEIARLSFYLKATASEDPMTEIKGMLCPKVQRALGPGGLETEVEAARETMRLAGQVAPKSIRTRYPMMLLRASTRVRAADASAPVAVRRGPMGQSVDTLDARQPYANYFTVEEHDMRFPRFDRAMSRQITRAAFVGGDAVTVLPYDPLNDRVLIIEQFRFAPHIRGDRAPWLLEPPAGRIDPGETPRAAAMRELTEETGLRARDLLEIGSYYPSPGAWTEYLYSFVALCDLPETGGRIAGLDTEEEDIYSHILSFDDAMRLMDTGECDAGPLWLSLLWLAGRRSGLRAPA